MSASILVVDDDPAIIHLLRRALSYDGYTVIAARSGQEALDQALAQPPDLVILDLMLPSLDGFEVCRRLRQGSGVPILMLTARDQVADRVRGLDTGADDYLIKPFALDELRARVRALIRRRPPDAPPVRRFNDLTVDLATREVWRHDKPVALTTREYELLLAFMRHPRRVLSRKQLLEQVWGFVPEVDTHVVAVYIGYLRRKLEATGASRLIHTVRGAGYVLREDATDGGRNLA